MPVDLENLQNRTRNLVASLYEKRHAPVPGAILMAALITDLRESGESTDVKSQFRSSGLRNFAAFVQQIPEIVFQRRAGSDFLVSPAGTGDVAKVFARPNSRIRRDFWRAFIEFANPNTKRIYDTNEDKILYQPINSTFNGIVIEPVPQDLQLEWRKNFAAESPESSRDQLIALLGRGGLEAFNDFARYIREHPETGGAWNRYQQNLLAENIENWASTNNVPSRVWEAVSSLESKAAPVSRRSEIYSLLDHIPLEEIVKLTVPLEWLLTIYRER